MTGQRARTVSELQTILDKLFTADGIENGLAFQPEPSDVIISPFAKSGTTWMQQIVHGLRTRGSMDFGEISEVVPWIEAAQDLGQDLTAAQIAQPRAFKSHLPWEEIPSGCRYICVLRDPIAVLKSMYQFFEGWIMEPGAIAFEDFAYHQFLARKAPKGYWHHLCSWMEQKDNPQVLLLCYEQLQNSLADTLPTIADFIGVKLDAELKDIVLTQSSLEFMQEHASHFDDHFLRLRQFEALGVPRHSLSSKVSSKKARRNRPLPSEALIQDMQNRWQQEVTVRTGFANYTALQQWFAARG